MKKYKVTLQLMVDPTKGDHTFDKSYEVEAEKEMSAYKIAEELHSNDIESIRYKSIFNYRIKEIT